MEATFIITIDGPAGSGKSSTARRVAEKLGFLYMDSGALYRAVTLAALEQNTELNDPGQVKALVHRCQIDLKKSNQELLVCLDGRNVTEHIRSPEVTRSIAPIAAMPEVRKELVNRMREMAKEQSLVAEGRDMGSVVFQRADLKIFMQATIEERAHRRQQELLQKGIHLSLQELVDGIKRRDHSDANRSHGPLVKPQDALVLDTSAMTLDEQVDWVVEKARKRGAA